MSEDPKGKSIGVGVIGLGFMGGTHIRAYHAAAAAGFPCRLAAVSDASEQRLTGVIANAGNLNSGQGDRLFDPSVVHTHLNADDLIADDSVDLVSICTYTDSHVELAIAAMNAGKHVLVEKPVARSTQEVERLAATARRSRRLCMPAMCMRFWPGWDWLRDRIADGSFGAVRSATFQRLGSQPAWAQAFYGDLARSGGALLDLHIHDADFIHWCFGWDDSPVSVSTTGSPQHLSTHYRFADGPAHLTAEAAWDLAPNAGFRMRYLVNFDRATAEFDLMRSPQLMVHDGAGSRAIELAATTGYDGEVRHILSAIRDGRTDLAATLDDSIKVMRMLEAEQASMESGTVVTV